jgi:hypothetical protein
MSEGVKKGFEEIYGKQNWPNLVLSYYDPLQTLFSLKLKLHFVISLALSFIAQNICILYNISSLLLHFKLFGTFTVYEIKKEDGVSVRYI